ncbi:MAG: panthothenate synthetase [Candidatus Dadabacteria bacterium]|nr:panthothenate synthetase [Candidatus Dadabacteria bacterium]
MKILLTASMPHEPFNNLVKEGKADQVMGSILEDLKPLSVYFTEIDGKRTALLIIEMENSSEIPKYAEPFFLNFNADCSFRIVMDSNDLKNAGLEELGKKWG